jgi:hypothetical protein
MISMESCNETKVRAILDNPESVERLTERRARDGDRQVFLLDGRYIVKRFAYSDSAPPTHRPWRREHDALCHLAEPTLPESIGYVEDHQDESRVIRYVRTYVPGEPVSGFDEASAREAGELLAALHARGVVTDDAQTQNFMRTADGRMFFLDFGKARIFTAGDPRFPIWIALDHCRFLRASINWDDALWAAFRRGYFDATSLGKVQQTAVRAVTFLLLWQRRLRRGVRR